MVDWSYNLALISQLVSTSTVTQSKAFLARRADVSKNCLLAAAIQKRQNIFSSYEFWIKVMNSNRQFDVYLPFQLQMWQMFLNLQSEQGRTMSANAFAFCLQTPGKKICFLHSGVSFNLSFVSPLHCKQCYTNLSKKHKLIMYVFHIFCAINKKTRLFHFSIYLIILPYLIYISLTAYHYFVFECYC